MTHFLPIAPESEKIVLGLALCDDHAAETVIACPERIFATRDHRHILSAISDAWQRHGAVNVATVVESLKRSGRFSEEGQGSATSLEYLLDLQDNLPPASQLPAHLRILRNYWRQRDLIDAAQRIVDGASQRPLDDSELSELEADFQTAAFQTIGAKDSDQGPQDLRTVVSNTFEDIQAKYEGKRPSVGLTSGLKSLDAASNGFHSSELIIVAARPGCGKTAFLLKLALAAAQQRPVYLASLEMSAQQIGERFFAMSACVDLRHVRSGQLQTHQWKSLTDALGRLSDYPIYVDDRANLSPAMLKSRVQRIAVDTKRPMGMILLDYLQLMSPGRRFDTREREIATISRDMKMLAKDLAIPVVVASQLNRQIEQRKDKRPILADLRESGALEQDADLVFGLYLPFNYSGVDEDRAKAEAIILKQRNGPVGTISLQWNAQTTNFFDTHI